MNLFSGIAFNDHYDTIHNAVAAIVQRAQRLGLTKSSWSLVELAPDEEDFHWLCQWAQCLSPAVANRCLVNGHYKQFDTNIGNFSDAAGIGVLLLLFAVEVARRNANERSLWMAVSQHSFSLNTQRVLFPNNYPTRAYKDCIELAVRKLNLRHVFGIQGLQNWYDSIYLQLGFTKLGFTSRLPEWLVGQNSTFAIQRLLDGPMSSATFQELWNALWMYRRKNISEQQLHRTLKASAWILPEWIPELIKQARTRLHLHDTTTSGRITSFSTEATEGDSFLDQPQLVWDPSGEPSFHSQLVNLTQLDLIESTYRLMIAGKTYAHLRRHTDGSYQSDLPYKITLPATSPLLIASIVTPNGSIIQNQTLQLWDEGEDISLFAYNKGYSLDPWEQIMSTQRSYYLLLSSDLEIQPQPTHWYRLNAHTSLYLLERDWPTDTQVLLAGQRLWQPRLSSLPRTSPSDILTKDDVHIYLHSTSVPLVFGRAVRFQIDHPQGYEITFLRSAGQSIEAKQHTANTTITERVTLQPHMFSGQTNPCIELTLWIRHINAPTATRLRYPIEVPLIGTALLGPDGWEAVDTNQPLSIEQTKKQPLRFYLKDIEDWALLEGDTWLTNPWKTPKPLQMCAGFGAPLKIQKSAYNASALDHPHQLASEVINTGCVKAISIENVNSGQSRRVHIQLTLPIEPDEEHTIVWWDQDGTYTFFKPEQWGTQPETMYWSAPLPALCTHPIAIAIAYNGMWLGTWYSEDWSRILTTNTIGADVTAALLRWLHLPLLSRNIFKDVVQFTEEHPLVALSVWLSENCSLSDLQFTSSDEGWLSTVRKVFSDWDPGHNTMELIERLSNSSLSSHPLEVIEQMVWKVSRVNPILMARILRAWINHYCIPQWSKQDAGRLIKHLEYNLAEVSETATWEQRKQQLRQELSHTMAVDIQFIQKALLERAIQSINGQPISALDQENLAVAMQVEPFRRLLSIHLLEFIEKQLEPTSHHPSPKKK